MRETQVVVGYGSGVLGMAVFETDDEKLVYRYDGCNRLINADVAAWRSGHRPDNPQSFNNRYAIPTQVYVMKG